jgi:hypothetical protein
MKTIHNIQRQISASIITLHTVMVSLCSDQILWFSYNNEPKQGGSWSGYIIS